MLRDDLQKAAEVSQPSSSIRTSESVMRNWDSLCVRVCVQVCTHVRIDAGVYLCMKKPKVNNLRHPLSCL